MMHQMRPCACFCLYLSDILDEQGMLEACLSKRQGNHYGPVLGKRIRFLIEDLNLPQKDLWGDEPCAEATRFILESGSVISLQKPGERKILHDVNFIATANVWQSPEVVPERLRSRCLVVLLPEPNFEARMEMFEPIIQGRNKLFPAVPYEIKDAFSHAYAGVIKLIMALHEELMPCRRFYHFNFSMHNTARLCQALLAVPPDADEISSDKIFASFFWHESERELCDQLPEEEKKVFRRLADDICKSHLKVDMKALRQSKPKYAKVIWTDIIAHKDTPIDATAEGSVHSKLAESTGRMKPMEGTARFVATAKAFLQKYNEKCLRKESDGDVMNLVLFEALVAHLLRLIRVLKLERGHMILVGASRSGKKSVIRLAAFIVEVSAHTRFCCPQIVCWRLGCRFW